MHRLHLRPTLMWALLFAAWPAVAQDAPDPLLDHWLAGSGLFPIEVSINADEMTPTVEVREEDLTPEQALEKVNGELAQAEERGLLLLRRAQAQLMLGSTEQAALDLLEAQNALREDLAKHPGDPRLLLALASVCAQVRDEDEARQLLRAGLDADPTEAAYLAHLMPLLESYDVALVDRSLTAVRAKLAADPGDSKALSDLFMLSMLRLADSDFHAEMLALAGEGDYAAIAERLDLIAPFQAHMQAHPESPVARWWLGKAYVVMAQTGTRSLMATAKRGSAQGPAAQFVAPAGELLADAPGDPRAHLATYNALIVYHALRGEGAEVIRVVEAARQAFPQNESLPFLHAELVAEVQGDGARGQAIANEAIEEVRTFSGLASLAWVSALAGDHDRARQLAGALLSEPEAIPATVARRAMLTIAYLQAAAGDYAGAEEIVDGVIEHAPGLDPAVDKAILLMLLGDSDAAEEILIDIATANPAEVASRALLAAMHS